MKSDFFQKRKIFWKKKELNEIRQKVHFLFYCGKFKYSSNHLGLLFFVLYYKRYQVVSYKTIMSLLQCRFWHIQYWAFYEEDCFVILT